MKILVALFLASVLSGCSTFKLGTVVYLPYGQVGEVRVGPGAEPAAASASEPAK